MISSMSTTRISTSSSSSSIPTGACFGAEAIEPHGEAAARRRSRHQARALYGSIAVHPKVRFFQNLFVSSLGQSASEFAFLLLASHNRPQKKAPVLRGFFFTGDVERGEGNMYSCSLPSEESVTPPKAGLHTLDVFAGFGVDADDIAELHEHGHIERSARLERHHFTAALRGCCRGCLAAPPSP